MPDYRAMTAGDWAFLIVTILLCLLAAGLLAFKPMLLWRSTQRWRAPDQKPEDLGEPTRGFKIFSWVLALAVLACAVYCAVSGFFPQWLER